jgi:CheY-like chemotaxis protein
MANGMLERITGVLGGRLVSPARRFPPDPPAPPASHASSRMVKTTTAPKRVLIVEDNLDSVHSLALLVADMGHTVEYAINGYVALEAAQRFRPDFVLLDLALPGMDGFEVSKRIKQIPELAHARLIALTAFAQDDYRVRSLAAGCELHIVKPVPIWLLEELLG